MPDIEIELHKFLTVYKDHDTGRRTYGPEIMAFSPDMAREVIVALIRKSYLCPGTKLEMDE